MEFEVHTDERVDVVDVTDAVEDAVPADTERGTCLVYVAHTTAGVIVNEAESGLHADLLAALERFAPSDETYRHDRIDDNADAHLRATLLGSSVTVPVEDGTLALGTWQSIQFVECDGPRTRRLRVTVTDA